MAANDELRPEALRDPTTGQLKLEWQRVFAEYAPAAFEAHRSVVWKALPDQELDDKVVELIMVAIDAAVLWPSPYIDLHIHRAFESGATIHEVLESILLAFRARGGHSLNHGLTAMGSAIRERDSAGLSTPRSR